MRTNQQLKDLHLPHCDWRDFLKFTGEGDIPRKDVEQMDHYFQHFVYLLDPLKPNNENLCIKCGHPQGGTQFEGAMGIARFRFGIVNGEGQCQTGGCNWPARAIHRNVGPLKSLELILQFHPDVVTWDKENHDNRSD